MKVLVINCGSSSLKYQLIDSDTEEVLAKGLCERIGIEGSMLTHQPAGKDKIKTEAPMPDHTVAVKMVIDALIDSENGVISSLEEIDAVGHRMVHGGEAFAKSTVINDDVLKAFEACNDLAPLHNPANLIGVHSCQEIMPGVPMVAVFDTAFHQTMPAKSYLYGIPYEYYKKYKVRRYGFHGTSHDYVSARLAEILGKKREDLKIVVCHLGNGASIAAIEGGKCVNTSMGFTPATDAFQKIKRNNIQLTYADDGFKATAYYLDRQRDKNQTRLIFNDFYGVDDETTKNYGLDIQKSWDIKNDKFLIGADYKRELFESDALSQKFKKDGSKPGGQKSGSVTRDYSGSQHRNDYSIYAQYEKKFNDKDSLSIAGRETWTAGGPNDVNFSNFSGQVQYMHKVKDNESLYASVGQSFKMPALYQIYKTDKNGVGAENLKPQKGVHYELGWKKDITDNQKLRVALYSYRVKDNITASISSKTNEFTYTNEDLKNFGVEVEYSNVRDKGFGYNLVASLSNPKSQSIDKDLNPSGFHPDQAKLQLVAGLKYKMGKFTSNLNASYLDKRETFKWDKKQVTKYGAKPYLLTDLNFKYQPEKNIGIFLNMNNILDRRDVVYYSESSNYYTTGFSFLAGAEFKF